MTSELFDLLNLDPSAKVDRNEFATEFLRMANRLMNEYSLEISGHSHRLAEIEFYLCHSNHEDVFAHQDELQKTNAQWYFHRQGGGSYKGGNYKGLDITFGKPGDGYGGILIRAIEDITTKDYIEGSCLVVNRILALSGVSEIEQLVSKPEFKLSADSSGLLWLKRNPTLPPLATYTSSRVGLTLKQTNGDRPFFIAKPYRFISHPSLVRKGRQNFILRLYMDNKSVNEIALITGATLKTIQKYIGTYESAKGLKKTAKDFQGEALDVDDLCLVHYYCK